MLYNFWIFFLFFFLKVISLATTECTQIHEWLYFFYVHQQIIYMCVWKKQKQNQNLNKPKATQQKTPNQTPKLERSNVNPSALL